MENKKISYLVPLLIAFSMAIGLFLGNFFNSKNGYKGISGSNGQEKYQKIQDIIDILDNRYVDSLNS